MREQADADPERDGTTHSGARVGPAAGQRRHAQPIEVQADACGASVYADRAAGLQYGREALCYYIDAIQEQAPASGFGRRCS